MRRFLLQIMGPSEKEPHACSIFYFRRKLEVRNNYSVIRSLSNRFGYLERRIINTRSTSSNYGKLTSSESKFPQEEGNIPRGGWTDGRTEVDAIINITSPFFSFPPFGSLAQRHKCSLVSSRSYNYYPRYRYRYWYR